MAGILLALTLGVRTAATGLRLLTLPCTLTASSSTLRASTLGMGTTGATGSQCVVSKKLENLTRADSGILSEPFVFSHSGSYNWSSTGLNGRSSLGHYWSSPTYSAAGSSCQSFHSIYLSPKNGNLKGFGYAVRSVVYE